MKTSPTGKKAKKKIKDRFWLAVMMMVMSEDSLVVAAVVMLVVNKDCCFVGRTLGLRCWWPPREVTMTWCMPSCTMTLTSTPPTR